MPRVRLGLLFVATAAAAMAEAQEDEPDLGFLEYLGSWEETDEEWLIVAELEGELEDEDEASDQDEETDELFTDEQEDE
jgi:hypothetical protein